MTQETVEDQDPSRLQKVLNHGFVRLVDYMGGDDAVVQSARVSYGKGTKTVSEDRTLIRYLLRHQHTTPFEQVNFRFHCKLPIFVARQWIRHRMGSFNEYSGRYSEMKDEFFIPEEETVTKQNPTNKQGGSTEPANFSESGLYGLWDDRGDSPDNWQEVFGLEQADSFAHYQGYLKAGVRKELARVNLPLSIYTEWYWKVDLHNLFHFLKLRMDSHAQYEIRVYGEAIYKLIQPLVPLCCEAFEDYKNQARTLSRMEQALLIDVIAGKELHPGMHEQYGMGKREWTEFFGWYDALRKSASPAETTAV